MENIDSAETDYLWIGVGQRGRKIVQDWILSE